MPEKNSLNSIDRMAEIFTDGAMTKQEGLKFIKAIQEFVLKLDAKQEQEIEAIRQSVQQVIQKVESKFDVTLGDLSSKVDGLFVSDRVKKLEDDHGTRMKGVDERMAKIRDGRNGAKGDRGERGPAGSPDTAKAIRNKLESLEDDDRLDASAIKGLDDLVKDVGTLKSRPVVISGNTGRDLFREKDISASFDGVTKTFNIGAFYRIISIDLSSYPYGSLRKSVDYTYNGTNGTVTFGDSIDAGTQLQSGQQCVISFVVA